MQARYRCLQYFEGCRYHVKNYALEFGQHNIRTNAIAPGLFRTDFAKALWENPEILKQSTATNPEKDWRA